MPEKPKQNKESEKKVTDDSWEKDQKEKNYYYDDACGYEVYDPDEDDEEEDNK